MSDEPAPIVRPRARRTTALACVLASVWVVTACAAESDEPDDPQSNPWREWIRPDAACPATLPMSPDGYPKALREQEGKSTWYGEGPLWVDLAGFYDAEQVDDRVVARHAWWTVDAAGEAILESGPPKVTATRLDGPGHKVATVRRGSDPASPYWRTRLTYPDVSCWLVTGELDGTVVRVVVQAP